MKSLNEFTLGDVIRRIRLEKGFSQQKISKGICTISALSKVENNIFIPPKYKLESILQRMGENPFRYTIYSSEREKNIHKYHYHFNSCINDNVELAVYIYKKIESLIDKNNVVEVQLTNLLQTQILVKKKEISFQEAYIRYEECLKLTIPEYNTIQMRNYLLSQNEWRSILQMIQMLMYSNRIQEALSLSLEIKAFFEREYIDKTLVDSDYEFLLLMLCEIYQVSNRLKEALMINDELLKRVYKTQRINNMIKVMMNRTFLVCRLNMEQSIVEEMVTQTIYLCKMFQKESMINNFILYLKKELHMNIEEKCL